MVVLVIGPSGVGKSDYGKHVERMNPKCRFFDLDRLVRERVGERVSQLLPRIGNDAFLELCQQEVTALSESCNESVAVVAVGAGALQSNLAGSWLSYHPDPTIAIIANSVEVYQRGGKRNQGRPFEEFFETEYSQYRQSLYKAAKYQCCVTGLSVEEARNCFADLIHRLVMEEDMGAVQQVSQQNAQKI